MGKLNNLLFLVTVFLSVSSCTMNSTKDVYSDPGMESAMDVWHTCTIPMMRAVELADFFHKYQEIRTDREASEDLAESLFGPFCISLYYEEAEVAGFGKIRPVEDAESGTYKVEASSSAVYTVTVKGDGTFDVILNRHEYYRRVTSGRAKAVIEAGRLSLNELEMLTTDSGVIMKCISTSDPLSVPVTRGGNISFPDSGKLLYTLSGDVSDRFYLTWSQDGSCHVSRD